MADVLNVEVERVRRLVGSLEGGERLPSQVGTHRVAVIQREQKAQIGDIGLEQREPAEVVSAVAWDDGEPRVQQVVGLVEEAAVVHGHGLHGLGRLVLNRSPVGPVQTSVSEQLPKKWP